MASASGQHEDERNCWYRMGFRVGRLVGAVRLRHATPATPVVPPPTPPPAPEWAPALLSTPPTTPARVAPWAPAQQTVAPRGADMRALIVPGQWPVPAGVRFVLGGVRLAGLIARGASGPTIALELGWLVWDVLVADRVAPWPGVAIARGLLGCGGEQ